MTLQRHHATAGNGGRPKLNAKIVDISLIPIHHAHALRDAGVDATHLTISTGDLKVTTPFLNSKLKDTDSERGAMSTAQNSVSKQRASAMSGSPWPRAQARTSNAKHNVRSGRVRQEPPTAKDINGLSKRKSKMLLKRFRVAIMNWAAHARARVFLRSFIKRITRSIILRCCPAQEKTENIQVGVHEAKCDELANNLDTENRRTPPVKESKTPIGSLLKNDYVRLGQRPRDFGSRNIHSGA